MAIDAPAARATGAGAGRDTLEVSPLPASRVGLPFAALTAAGGGLLVAFAFRLQYQGYSQGFTACLFWAGMLVGILPAARVLLRLGTTRADAVVALLLLAGVTAAPRLLRANGPLFPDEFAAWRQTVDAIGGYAGAPGGFVPGVEGYPGLHLLIGGLASVSGLSVWAAAAVLMTVAHVIGALAVFSVAETLLGRTRTAGIAALVYLLNPVSLYVGMRIAPESLALPLTLAALALAVLACVADSRGLRRGLVAVAALLLVLVALTDGTVGLMALVVLCLVLVGAVWRTRQHPIQVLVQSDGSVVRRPVGTDEFPEVWARLAAVLGAAMLAVAVALAATDGAFEQAADWFPSRGLFGMPGRTPAVEVLLTAVAPVLVLLVAAEGVWRLWSQPRRRTGRLLALATVGVAYFPLVPLVLLPTLGPAVRTAWALTYLGVALLAAPVVLRRYDRLRRRERWIVERITAGPLISLLLAVVLIGNSAASAGAGYRYAGPTRFGAEGRDDSAELRDIAATFAADNGRTGILTDRYSGPAFAAFSGSRLARATTLLPGSELMQGVDPTVPGVTDLVRRGYTHLVVDTRMANVTPLDGDSYGPQDKGEGYATRQTALLRLDRVPWVSRVAASEHYRVYRIDLGGAGKPLVEQADAWGPDFRPSDGGTPAGLPASPPVPPAAAPATSTGTPAGAGASAAAAGTGTASGSRTVPVRSGTASTSRSTMAAWPVAGAAARAGAGGGLARPRPAAATPGKPGAKPARPAARPAAKPGAKPARPAAAAKPGKPTARPGKPTGRPHKPAARPGKPAGKPHKPGRASGSARPGARPAATPPRGFGFGVAAPSAHPAKPGKPGKPGRRPHQVAGPEPHGMVARPTKPSGPARAAGPRPAGPRPQARAAAGPAAEPGHGRATPPRPAHPGRPAPARHGFPHADDPKAVEPHSPSVAPGQARRTEGPGR